MIAAGLTGMSSEGSKSSERAILARSEAECQLGWECEASKETWTLELVAMEFSRLQHS